jgi:hypothetical protein
MELEDCLVLMINWHYKTIKKNDSITKNPITVTVQIKDPRLIPRSKVEPQAE